MNISESTGESSCKRQEDGDLSTGSDRPLKKARFAWQVKGKYHLKNEIPESKNSVPTNETDRAGSSLKVESDSNSLVGSTEQNLEILGDYLLKQDFNTLDSVIADSDKSLLKPSPSISTEKLEYPRYVSSFENSQSKRDTLSNVCNNEHISIPMSMVFNYSEEQCIARWQARQMAKGFVDNTINRVLDSWMVAPLPSHTDNNRFLALDVAEFINNLPGDNSIENEGILMAISAHGLQNASSPSSHNDNFNSEQTCSSSSIKDTFSSSPNSPLISDDEAEETSHKRKQSDIDSNEIDMSWPCSDNTKNNDVAGFSLFPDGASTYQYYSESDYNSPNNEYEENVNTSDNDVMNSHYDFLDAAVSFAIQNKGLTSFGTDYG